MNIKTGALFQMITNAANKLVNETSEALEKYARERDEARRTASEYKDEAARFEGQRSFLANVARERIEKSERLFVNSVRELENKLTDELMQHLNTPLSTSFANEITLIRQCKLKPTRAEIQHLVDLNNGNSIGLSALDSVLKTNKSAFHLSYTGTEELEKDLEIIHELTDHPRFIPMAQHVEGVEVFKGAQREFTAKDGSVYTNGMLWDGVAIQIERAEFERRMNAIAEMSDRWTAATGYPSIEEVATEERERAEARSEEPPEEPESAVTIERNDKGTEIGAELGRERAAGQEMYSRTMGTYQK